MKGTKIKAPVRTVTIQEREAFKQEIEKKYPGYLDENLRLITIVRIFTGIRVLYGLFYLFITMIYSLPITQGFLTVFGALFFFMWYSWMLKSGKGIAIMMLCLRGFSIVTGGVSILEMSYWLPYPLIFTLTAACVMEFCEAVFCIYILFNRNAAMTIRLNREMEAQLMRGVSSGTLERMAEYQNPHVNTSSDEEENHGESGEEGGGD